MDWKYALGLELTAPGFDFSVLSEFRGQLIEDNGEQILRDRLLDVFQDKKMQSRAMATSASPSGFDTVWPACRH